VQRRTLSAVHRLVEDPDFGAATRARENGAGIALDLVQEAPGPVAAGVVDDHQLLVDRYGGDAAEDVEDVALFVVDGNDDRQLHGRGTLVRTAGRCQRVDFARSIRY
jgi:hypothetical protein